jgi:hypothetical protein
VLLSVFSPLCSWFCPPCSRAGAARGAVPAAASACVPVG